jgi:hypothetical protein
MPGRSESLDDVVARVKFYSDGPPGTDAYCDSGEALKDALTLAHEVFRLNVEREHYRIALERIEVEDHEGGPGWFAEIAAEALHRYRM